MYIKYKCKNLSHTSTTKQAVEKFSTCWILKNKQIKLDGFIFKILANLELIKCKLSKYFMWQKSTYTGTIKMLNYHECLFLNLK